MLRIGVPCCFLYPDKNRTVFSPKTLCYIDKDMARYLSRKDVMPVMIPDLEDEELYPFLNEMNGFVFHGGTDVAPQTYHEEPILEGKWPGDAYRDAFELKILDYAVKNDVPVLGICRGFQIMNVYFGGTLYQDIATQKPNSLVHRDAEKYDQLSHPIALNEGKLLYKLYKDEPEKTVNSVHHQGVKDLGKDLEVLAYCPIDGIVEAIGWKGAEEGRVMGVQWHPEFFYNYKNGKLINADKVYENFLKLCG
ncbi:MAG TPA: gamma-glutamyl-gamma-aminobutyrate hydrolase family protein [Chitinophagales bacterium]|nr:gamma-glutamyl-gamma-aminobutyrate hydrolase family protein [Chitinophagales bacterium]